MKEEHKPFRDDWELSEDYYEETGEERSMSLEDFITEDAYGADNGSLGQGKYEDGLFEKTVEDVRRVMELSLKGNDIGQIVAFTGLDETYVYSILVCAQGFREDDEIAVAHLVLG